MDRVEVVKKSYHVTRAASGTGIMLNQTVYVDLQNNSAETRTKA